MNKARCISSSIGTSFIAPSFNELYFPGFGITSNRPERGRNAEIGVGYVREGHQFSATYFQNRLKDLLVYAPVCPVEVETHRFGCTYNVNRDQLSGLPLSGSVPLLWPPVALAGTGWPALIRAL